MRKFFGVLFIVLGVLTSIPVLTAWSLRTTLLQSAPWKASLLEARVYERALEELPAILLSEPENFGDAIAVTPLSAADMADVVQAVIPATLLKDVVERGIEVGLALVKSEVQWEQASLVVSLQDIKVRAPVEIQNLLVKKIQALPTCTDAQLQAYALRKDLNGALPPCKPKGVDVRALVSASVPVQEITNAIPSTVDVLAEVRKQASAQQPCNEQTVQASAVSNVAPCTQRNPAQDITEVQRVARMGLQIHFFLTLLCAAFFLGAFAVFLPNLRASFRWFGVGVGIAGAGNLYLAWQGRMQLGRDVVEPTDQLGQALQSIFLPVAKNLGNQATARMLLLAALVLLVGIVAFAVSYAWKPKPKM